MNELYVRLTLCVGLIRLGLGLIDVAIMRDVFFIIRIGRLVGEWVGRWGGRLVGLWEWIQLLLGDLLVDLLVECFKLLLVEQLDQLANFEGYFAENLEGHLELALELKVVRAVNFM